MPQNLRQAELFAGEDWTVLYRAFTQINFNSYDPPSINKALREYIKTNYPEDFSDWIESSEFVAIIDLLSWLAGSLAFRTDVNARENFLETAQSRESVLRLARFLSYNPRRAQSARGLVKIVEIKTTQNVVDSFGVNLNNRPVKWNDPDNPDWMEQFTLIMNAAMPTTNPFGVPLKSASLGGANTQLYQLTSLTNQQCIYKFDAQINGSTETFEIVNVDIEADQGFNERVPEPESAFHLTYRNDGRGNSSERTGFFLMFKQGTLQQRSFDINTPLENRLIDIDVDNISDTDVWVQTLNDDDTVDTKWTKVPAIYNENITFNNVSTAVRNIFSVITRDDDKVSLRFGDGRFGAVPVGSMRVWYRTVNGLQYQIRPRDIENISIVVPYRDVSGRLHDLTFKFSLQEAISNAVRKEDIEQIRRRAPQVYGTQNRMVSGEDYNAFPLSNNQVVKLRAVNRVYSGHSRYVDINDPTSSFQDTVVFADDGILYREQATQYTQVTTSANFTSEQIVGQKIQTMLSHHTLRDYFTDRFASLTPVTFPENKFVWRTRGGIGFNALGDLDSSAWVGATTLERETLIKYFGLDCLLLFTWASPDPRNPIVKAWAKVTATDLNSVIFDERVTNGGLTESPITVNEAIPDGASIIQIIPTFRNKLEARAVDNQPEWDSEVAMVVDFVAKRKPFKLYYDPAAKTALKFSAVELSGKWTAIETQDTSEPGTLVMTASYIGGLYWSLSVGAGTRYVFESLRDVLWHDVKANKEINGTTGASSRDTVTLIWPNRDNDRIVFDLIDNVYYPDGFPDYRKIVVSPTSSDDDGSVDEPDSFRRAVGVDGFTQAVSVGEQDLGVVIFKKDQTSTFNSLVHVPMPVVKEADAADLGLPSGTVFYDKWGGPTILSGVFYKMGGEFPVQLTSAEAAEYVVKVGKSNFNFKWQHFAGHETRIDPAITNIIDVFVLTSEYDYLVKQWIADGAKAGEVPDAPTDIDLRLMFQEFEQHKMFSDQIIWRPVSYKYLFGEQSAPELRCQFKIVKLAGASLSDGEIRTKVISAINEFFDVNKWEFGETFYFTELAAYIHFKLASSISSIVIVPLRDDGKFGELFEVRCATNEVFISTAQVGDVVIIDGNSMANLRIS